MKKVKLAKNKNFKALANSSAEGWFCGWTNKGIDFRPLLDKYEAFDLLKNEAFFKSYVVFKLLWKKLLQK